MQWCFHIRPFWQAVRPAYGVIFCRKPRLTGTRLFGGSTRVNHSGHPLGWSTSGVPLWFPRATPFLLLLSYITRGLLVVDRTLCACPVTCSSRHLISHLFIRYKHYSFSSHTGRVNYSLCDFSVGQATSLGFWLQRDSHLSLYTSRLRPRLHKTKWSFILCAH